MLDDRTFTWLATESDKRPGHADLSTTQRYMHLSPAATEDAIRLFDGREFGAMNVKKFGDILDTQTASNGSSCESGR